MSFANTALLASLNISTFTNGRKDNKATEETNNAQNAKADAGYYRKCLVDPASLKPITNIASEARRYHKEKTAPWGKKGEQLLPAKLHLEYNTKMRELKAKFADEVVKFVAQWPSLVQDAQAILGNMYDPDDYPSQTDIVKEFSFETKIDAVPTKDDFRVQIHESELKAIQKELEDRIRKQEAEAYANLWDRLYEPVKHMAEKLSDPKARFHNTLVTNLINVIEFMEALNVNQDQQLSALANDIKDKLCVYEPETLRKDPEVRQQTAKAAADISDMMDIAMGKTSNQQAA